MIKSAWEIKEIILVNGKRKKERKKERKNAMQKSHLR